jgi:hypothetical protein
MRGNVTVAHAAQHRGETTPPHHNVIKYKPYKRLPKEQNHRSVRFAVSNDRLIKNPLDSFQCDAVDEALFFERSQESRNLVLRALPANIKVPAEGLDDL